MSDEPRKMTPALTPELVELIDNPPENTRMAMWIIRLSRQLYRELASLAEQNSETLQHTYRLLRRILAVVFIAIALVFAIEVATGIATLNLIHQHAGDAARLKHAEQQSRYQSELSDCRKNNARYAKSTAFIGLLARVQGGGVPSKAVVGELLRAEGIKPTPILVATVRKIETPPPSPLLKAQLEQSQLQLNTLINDLTTKREDCRAYAASRVKLK